MDEKNRRIKELEDEVNLLKSKAAGLQKVLDARKSGGTATNWKELLQKPEWILNLISQKIGFDIADDIPDEHEEDAEFVIEQDATLPLKSGALKGKYTGWKRKGEFNGRGVFTSNDLKLLIEGRWRDGKQHGIGWKFERFPKDDECTMGHWSYGRFTTGMMYFDNSEQSTIKCYNDRIAEWETLKTFP